MKLTDDELEVLEDINCYDDEETLVYEEIDKWRKKHKRKGL